MSRGFVQFNGTAGYVTSPALSDAVNVSLALERPLLLKGEPGTGKTVLARHVAENLGMRLLTWHIKSTSKAQEGLYVYDTVQRLNDSRFGGGNVADIRHYIKLGPLGHAFASPDRVVLLIDEVDKADLEFPNDLLRELDEMAFHIPELDETVRARHRPITIITSNAEKELPDAFLRRCVFHYITFPDAAQMERIVRVHFPDLAGDLVKVALERFFALRKVRGLKKPPSTSELLDWLTVLIQMGADASALDAQHPFLGVLLKNERDIEAVRRGGR